MYNVACRALCGDTEGLPHPANSVATVGNSISWSPPPPPWGEVVTVVLSLRSSPTHAMEALRHEHERDLVEVKGIAVWILNVLVDATRHHGETETTDQNSGLVDLH